MDPARREELLKAWKPPLAVMLRQPSRDDSLSRQRVAIGREMGAPELQVEPIAGDFTGKELAFLLVEAFNAHFGQRQPGIHPPIVDAFWQIAELAGRKQAITLYDLEQITSLVAAWKRDSEELAEIKRTDRTWKDIAFGFLNEIAVLALGDKGFSIDDVVSLPGIVRGWRAKAAKLDAIREEDEAEEGAGRAAEADLERLIADLVHEDCRRAAARLAGCFEWNKAETGLAAEVIFCEVRGANRPPIGERIDDASF